MPIEQPVIKVKFEEKGETLDALLMQGNHSQGYNATADLIVLGRDAELRVYFMNPEDELTRSRSIGYIELGKCQNEEGKTTGTFSLSRDPSPRIKYDGQEVGWVMNKDTLGIVTPTAGKFRETLPMLYQALRELTEKHPEKLQYSKQYYATQEYRLRTGRSGQYVGRI
jgi:hypothetical protein